MDILIRVYNYIFFIEGDIVEQNTFSSDEDALKHGRKLEEERNKKVHVARWLEG
jgi:hypothetical protein